MVDPSSSALRAPLPLRVVDTVSCLDSMATLLISTEGCQNRSTHEHTVEYLQSYKNTLQGYQMATHPAIVILKSFVWCQTETEEVHFGYSNLVESHSIHVPSLSNVS